MLKDCAYWGPLLTLFFLVNHISAAGRTPITIAVGDDAESRAIQLAWGRQNVNSLKAKDWCHAFEGEFFYINKHFEVNFVRGRETGIFSTPKFRFGYGRWEEFEPFCPCCFPYLLDWMCRDYRFEYSQEWKDYLWSLHYYQIRLGYWEEYNGDPDDMPKAPTPPARPKRKI